MEIFIETKQKFLRPSTFERLIRKHFGKCKRSKIVLGIVDDNLAMAYQTPDGALVAFIGLENIFFGKDIAFPEPVRTEQRLILNVSNEERVVEKAYLIVKPNKKRLFVVQLLRSSAELNIEYHPTKCPRTWNTMIRDMNRQAQAVFDYHQEYGTAGT